MATWNPDERLNDLTAELQMDGGDQVKAAERIFKENLVLSAQSICHTAVYCENERVRLDAAKYVVERNMGRLGDDSSTSEDPIEALIREITRDSSNTAS